MSYAGIIASSILASLGAGGVVEPPEPGVDPIYGQHRYWGIETVPFPQGYASLAEIELYDTPITGFNLATDPSKAFASDAVGESEAASKAFDGDYTTIWAANNGTVTHRVWYDFEASPRDIKQVRILTRQSFPDLTPTVMWVIYSDDAVNWTRAWMISRDRPWGTRESFTTRSPLYVVKPDFVMPKHRYWAMLMQDNTFSGGFGMREMEWREDIGGPDKTGSGVATSTSNHSGEPPSQYFDNNTSTVSSTQGRNSQYVYYDFGAGNEVAIKEVQTTARAGGDVGQRPTAFEMLWSDDGVTYYPAWLGKLRAATVDNQVDTTNIFDAPMHRYWRLRMTASGGEGGLELSNLRLLEGADARKDGTVTATSTYAGFSAQNMFGSGDWASDFSNTWPQDLLIDYGSGNGKRIGAAIVSGTGPGRMPKSGNLAWSDDGVNYTQLFAWENLALNPAGTLLGDVRVSTPVPGKHRYWRIDADTLFGGDAELWYASDLRLYDGAVAQKDGTVTSPDSYPGFNPQLLFSGTSGWASRGKAGPGPLSLYVDYGWNNLKAVTGLEISVPDASSRVMKSGRLSWSDNNVDWTLVTSFIKDAVTNPMVYVVYEEPEEPEEPGEPGVGAARHWRIFVNDAVTPGQFVCLNEVEMTDVLGGADLTSPAGVVTASSEYGSLGGEAFNAFNNTLDLASIIFIGGRAWITAAAGSNHWIAYDFGAGNAKAITEVRIRPDSTDDRAPGSFKIQKSDDGTTWGDVWTPAVQTSWPVGEWRTFTKP